MGPNSFSGLVFITKFYSNTTYNRQSGPAKEGKHIKHLSYLTEEKYGVRNVNISKFKRQGIEAEIT